MTLATTRNRNCRQRTTNHIAAIARMPHTVRTLVRSISLAPLGLILWFIIHSNLGGAQRDFWTGTLQPLTFTPRYHIAHLHPLSPFTRIILRIVSSHSNTPPPPTTSISHTRSWPGYHNSPQPRPWPNNSASHTTGYSISSLCLVPRRMSGLRELFVCRMHGLWFLGRRGRCRRDRTMRLRKGWRER